MILQLSKVDQESVKFGPSDPIFITRILQKYMNTWGHPWKILFLISQLFRNPKFQKRNESPAFFCDFTIRDQRQLVSPSVSVKTSKTRWWNLSKSWTCVNLLKMQVIFNNKHMFKRVFSMFPDPYNLGVFSFLVFLVL